MTKTEPLKQKYDKLKLRTVGYILGICQAIRQKGGDKELREIIDQAARNSAHTIKVENLRDLPNKAEALGNELEGMLQDFDTQYITPTQSEGTYRVDNPNCGCLPPFLQLAERYGFTQEEARDYACRRCMPSYKEVAIQSGLGFQGKLTEKGCFMEFKVGKDAKL